jgi:hypothetical protein
MTQIQHQSYVLYYEVKKMSTTVSQEDELSTLITHHGSSICPAKASIFKICNNVQNIKANALHCSSSRRNNFGN